MEGSAEWTAIRFEPGGMVMSHRSSILQPSSTFTGDVMKDDLVAKAIMFASYSYGGRGDASERDIAHTLRVMFTVRDQMWSEETQAAAVCYLTLENTPENYDVLVEKFGLQIADAVKALSVKPNESFMAYIRRCKADPTARVIQVAILLDKAAEDNINKLPVSERDVFKKYRRALQFIMASDEDAGKLEF